MDIDKLKELRNIGDCLATLSDEDLAEMVIAMSAVQNWITKTRVLIDEAIARQSVTDEAVRDAIEHIKVSMSDSEIFRDGDFGIPVKTSMEFLQIRKTILTALQQMRTEPCESCREILSTEKPEVELYWTGHMAEGIIATYCPRCGRKLKGE